MTDIIERIVKPEDCVLAFGIPSDQESFSRVSQLDEVRRFSYPFDCWPEYLKAVPVEKFLPLFYEMGMRVVRKVDRAEYGNLFDIGASVIILFSHWDEKTDEVEFNDDFASIEKMITQTPTKEQFLIDLSVCTSQKLAKAIKNERGDNCYVKYVDLKLTADTWLAFLLTVTRALFDYNLTYGQALERAAIAWLKPTN